MAGHVLVLCAWRAKSTWPVIPGERAARRRFPGCSGEVEEFDAAGKHAQARAVLAESTKTHVRRGNRTTCERVEIRNGMTARTQSDAGADTRSNARGVTAKPPTSSSPHNIQAHPSTPPDPTILSPPMILIPAQSNPRPGQFNRPTTNPRHPAMAHAPPSPPARRWEG